MSVNNFNVEQYIGCNDWFFVHTTDDGEKIIHRIAAWGKLADGSLIGYIGVRKHPINNQPISLSPIPQISGCYVHKNDMTEKERIELDKIHKK
jgi:hypothetical protein